MIFFSTVFTVEKELNSSSIPFELFHSPIKQLIFNEKLYCIKQQTIDTTYHIMDRNQLHPLKKVNSVVDLGVHFDNNLTFREHMTEKFNKAYSVLGIIKRNFIYMDEHTFILLYKAMVHPHIEFANSVWCPYKLGDIKDMVKVVKRATKLIIKQKINHTETDYFI